MERDSWRNFATCSNKVMVVVDADSGKNLATLSIGAYSDGAAFDPIRKLAFSSNGEQTLSIIREKDANVFFALPPGKVPLSVRTMDIDPKGGYLFLAAADVAKVGPPAIPGSWPRLTYVPWSLN